MAWKCELESRLGPTQTVRRFRFDNGLVVLLAAKHQAPIVAIQTWFRVGSRNETPGATGLAHLFEHLMFSATATRAAGEFDRIIERMGGESNAATWVDWTYYRLSVPARDVATALDVEYERMHALALAPQAVEAERDVVTNERRERVEDDVDGWLDEQLMATAFTTHPYRWPTIGWMADIRSVSLATIRDFYQTWYAPNNAVMVLVGDFDEHHVLDVIATRQGALPAVTLPTQTLPAEPPQTAPRLMRATKPIATHRILIGFKAPAQHHPDWAHLEILATLLAGCPSARLHRRLVIEAEIASSVDAQMTPFADPSLFRIAVTCARDHQADEVLAVVEDELAKLRNTQITAAELRKAKHLAETDFWSAMADIDGMAETLGHHEVTLGDFRQLTAMVERLEATTAEDIHRAATTYFVAAGRTIVIADPDPDYAAEDDNNEDRETDAETEDSDRAEPGADAAPARVATAAGAAQ